MKRVFSFALVCAFITLSLAAQTQAKDVWISVRSKNFFLVGNASEKEIRQVATKLEQFRETFRLLFPSVKMTQSVQTNVVVFKNDSAYNPFRPKLANGKPDENIAGYFQPGEDMNYITLAAGGEKADVYGTIFHEYIHFLLDTNLGKSDIPPWFNEGLAEYYQTFEIEADQKVKLGNLQSGHLYLLQQTELIPLKTFFEVDNYSLHRNGNHSRSIFYAQAWALIHYLIQGNKGANNENLDKFVSLVMNDVEPEKAFQQAFQMDYAAMETALRKYVEQRKFQMSVVTFKNKLVFDTEMTTVPLSDAEANAYLGDLLYHTHEFADAENYLQKAVALDADSSLANTSLGLVKMRQRKFDEAKKYLEKAIAGDRRNHLAHYNYAYILSREAMDEFGYVSKYQPETVKKMRESLQKAIEINPSFTESYRMLAFINFVNNENLDESVALLKKGLALQPGNQEYTLLIAQTYLRQEKYAEAKEIAEKIAKTASEPQMRANAERLLSSVKQYEEQKAFYEKQQKDMEAKGIRIVKKNGENPLSEEELARINRENEINSLNRIIERPKDGETQVVGYIEKVTCAGGAVNYQVKTETEAFTLSSKDFSALNLMAMIEEAQNLEFGCDAQVKDYLTVITYRPNTNPKIKSKGNLVSIVFVPKYFKLKTEEELAKAQKIIVVDDAPPQSQENNPNAQAEMEQRRREAMLQGIKNALRQPQEGETRILGVVEKIECREKLVIFHAKIGAQTLKLQAASPQSVRMASFTPDAAQMTMGCGVTLAPIPVVITYRSLAGSLTSRNDGDLISLEFVPKSFKLE